MLIFCACALSSIERIVSSDGGLRLSTRPAIEWRNGTCPEAGSLRVKHDERFQTVFGFGASLLEAGAANLNALPVAKQTELLELLFGKTGAQLSALKTTMLGNDFSTATHGRWTTYDDSPEDFELRNFSIARDLGPDGSLSFLKRALGAGFDGTIQSYMDYPPDWMLDPGRATLRADCYEVLALYMARYVQAYRDQGVQLDFLECFNEPFDSYTELNADQLAVFLGGHVGPLFERLGLWPQTKLTYGGQCSRESASRFVPAVLLDPAAARYMDVIAYHGYDCQFNCTDERQHYDLIAQLASREPNRPLWMTEVCYAYNGDDPNCTSAATLQECVDYPRNHSLAPPLPRRDFADGATWGHRIVRELQAGASGWIYWNLLLDLSGGPFNLSPKHNDGPNNYQHPVIIADPGRGVFHTTGLFYFLAHFSKFVRPGAVRLGTREAALPEGVSGVAFAAEAGGTVVQLVNRGTVELPVTVCNGERVASVNLPAMSITTARWRQDRQDRPGAIY